MMVGREVEVASRPARTAGEVALCVNGLSTGKLKDISFEAKPGETVALVGHTGSGKTSIISLIARVATRARHGRAHD